MTVTLTPLAGFFVAFLIVWAVTPTVRNWAVRVGGIDKENLRKIHAGDIPRLGGIAIAIGFYVPLLALATRVNLFEQSIYEQPKRVLALLVGGLAILALGIYDDFSGASAAKKLAVQIPVAVMTWVLGVRIGVTSIAGVTEIVLPAWMSLIATVFWIVLVINALNLIDGLDGLASGIALQALLAVAICAWHRDDPALALISICLAGSVAGFLIHNFHPATIFMGDSGSMLLGYILATASIWSSQKTATAVGVVLPLVVLAVPLLDTSLAVWRRLITGQRLFNGDLDHIHHRVLAIASTQRRSVLLLYGVGLLFNSLSLVIVYANQPVLQWIIVVLSLAVALAFARWLGYVRPRVFAITADVRRRNLLVRRALQELEQGLMRSTSREDAAKQVARFQALIANEFDQETATPLHPAVPAQPAAPPVRRAH
jgi:UDP-GlcNAc:undecaprenyl-phosphate GlcNAc-1-phosphate transferase